MNLDQIRQRMKELVDIYVNLETPKPDGRPHWDRRFYQRLRDRQAVFYTAMFELEERLVELLKASASPAVEPPTSQPSTTTVVVGTARRRGRPPTGGRKPRDRRKHPYDEEYQPKSS